MDIGSIRKWVLKMFKLHGYSVKSEAAGFLSAQLAPLALEVRQTWMNKITKKIHDLNIDTLAIDKEHIVLCLEDCMRKQPSSETIFSVINAFETPLYTFDNERNKFVKDLIHNSKSLLGPPSMKSHVFRRRYYILLQKTKRHDLFRKQAFGHSDGVKFELRTAEWYLCTTDKIDNAVMLGLLVQRGDGHFDLEDVTGAVKLDLSKCKFHDGLFTEHCFVLVEGTYDDKVFYVSGLGLPPSETAKKSRPYFGNVNVFGGVSELPLNQSMSLLEIQNNNPGAMIVFLSDVWLDDFKVVEKLKILFEGFEQTPPVAFVLLGNFLSMQVSADYPAKLKDGLKTLGDIISNSRKICEKSQIVLVPGPSDPGSPLVFPRAPLPDCLTEDIRKMVPRLMLATNPCRIQFCTREVVVIREDLLTKMCRNVIHFPTSDDPQTHFAKTLTSQGTLAPLPLHISPVYWNYSHALDMYPLPDLVVVGDQYDAFTRSHMECQITNPSSFRKTKFSFHVYSPATNEVETSIIPEEE